jgi:Uri superfamily endonuclease
MELKKYIEHTANLIPISVKHLQLIEYKEKKYDFVYGIYEYHSSFKRMFKQIKRLIIRKNRVCQN